MSGGGNEFTNDATGQIQGDTGEPDDHDLQSTVTLVSIPIVGEWQATDKPWRVDFRPDNTLVSSTGSAQPKAAEAWTSGPGVYSVDYFGTLWMTLNNGKKFTATLTTETPNRFDLIESGVESVTVFERAQPKPGLPSALKKSRG